MSDQSPERRKQSAGRAQESLQRPPRHRRQDPEPGREDGLLSRQGPRCRTQVARLERSRQRAPERAGAWCSAVAEQAGLDPERVLPRQFCQVGDQRQEHPPRRALPGALSGADTACCGGQRRGGVHQEDPGRETRGPGECRAPEHHPQHRRDPVSRSGGRPGPVHGRLLLASALDGETLGGSIRRSKRPRRCSRRTTNVPTSRSVSTS